MKVGSSLRASSSGMLPIEPVTSSAKTMPSEFGCVGLSRLSRNFTPFGSISGWQLFCLNTSWRGSTVRACAIASFAICMPSVRM